MQSKEEAREYRHTLVQLDCVAQRTFFRVLRRQLTEDAERVCIQRLLCSIGIPLETNYFPPLGIMWRAYRERPILSHAHITRKPCPNMFVHGLLTLVLERCGITTRPVRT